MNPDFRIYESWFLNDAVLSCAFLKEDVYETCFWAHVFFSPQPGIQIRVFRTSGLGATFPHELRTKFRFGGLHRGLHRVLEDLVRGILQI